MTYGSKRGWMDIQMTIERPGEEKEVTVWGKVYPGRKGVHTLSNGDPGYPDEPPHLDIDEDALFVRPDGYTEHIKLTDMELSLAEEKLWEEHADLSSAGEPE